MGEARRKISKERTLTDNKAPTATIAQLGPIDAKQCPKCHTIYPQIQGREPHTLCENIHCLHRSSAIHQVRDIKVTIHYGEEGAF